MKIAGNEDKVSITSLATTTALNTVKEYLTFVV